VDISKDRECVSMGWIYMAEDKEQWLALANTETRFLVP
jgi:hypothetical protein